MLGRYKYWLYRWMLGYVEGMNTEDCWSGHIIDRTGIIMVIRFKCYYGEMWIQRWIVLLLLWFGIACVVTGISCVGGLRWWLSVYWSCRGYEWSVEVVKVQFLVVWVWIRLCWSTWSLGYKLSWCWVMS